MRDHLGPGRPGQVGGRVARAVVHHQDVDVHAGDVRGHGVQNGGQPRLFIARDHDRQRAPRGGSAHLGVSGRDQRAPACGSGCVHAQESADGVGQLAHRARLGADRARHRTLAPDHERHGALAPVQVAVAADAATLAVIGHQDHRGAFELAALAEEGQEVAHVAVRGLHLLQVLVVARAAHVAQLVGGQQLQHQQVGVLLLHDRAPGGGQRVVDARGGLHRRDRPHHLLAERIQQVRDAHQAAALACALQGVEHRLAADSQPRREVGAHAVLGRRGAGEHGREADHRPGRVRGVHVQVLGALACEAVHGGRVGLPHALAVGAVHHDHVNAAGTALCVARCGAVEAGGVGGQHVALEAAPGDEAQPAGNRHADGDGGGAARGRLLGQQRGRAERHDHLRHLLEHVAAGGVRVGGHQPPEAGEVGPRRARAQVVVERAPEEDGEEDPAGQGARQERGRAPRLQQGERYGERQPQQRPAAQREREARQRDRHGQGTEQRPPQPAAGSEAERRRREEHHHRVDDRERLALVEDVPGPCGPDLEKARFLHDFSTSLRAR